MKSTTAHDQLNPNLQTKAEAIKVEELTTDDVIVAVMGPTGSGKSSFIELATGISGIAGHGLASCTKEISVFKLSFPGFHLCFVDTPGFDDTNKSDVEILKMISDWLIHTYKRQIRLRALLYFHRISDNRLAGSSLKNFHLFRELCGEDFNGIIMTTTMWDEVDEELGVAREKELINIYWKAMIERGSYVKRFLFSRQSAFGILMPILEEAQKRSTLLLQTEMNDQGLRLRETSAGKALYVELTDLVSRHQEILGRIRNDLKDRTVDQDQLQFLMQEYQEVSVQLQRASEDMRKMKISTVVRIHRAVSILDWKRFVRTISFKRRLKEAKERARKEKEEKEILEAYAKQCEEKAEMWEERYQASEETLEVTVKVWQERERELEKEMETLRRERDILKAQNRALVKEVNLWQELERQKNLVDEGTAKG